MKQFLDDNFLLTTETSEILYHTYAKDLPIIDYHNHLSPEAIANNTQFDNITQAWLNGDHYKWRAMRANGVYEGFITGNKSDREKFDQWAATVPYTMRNPLYHWTHLELKRYFNIHDQLSAQTSGKIYEQANRLLQTDDYRVRGLLKKMKVELVCTTDDPIDSLEHHQAIREENIECEHQYL